MDYDFCVVSLCHSIFCLYLFSLFMDMMKDSFGFVCFQEESKYVMFCPSPKVFRLNVLALFVNQRHLNIQGKSIF